MEEILASIRRIIADDEAKPAGDKIPAPVAAATPPKPVMKDIPLSAISASQAATAKPPARPAPPPPPLPPAAAVPNSQDDIDAMLASLDETTAEAEIRPPQPDGEVFDLTDEMALPEPPPRPAAPRANSFQKVDPEDDLEFAEAVAARATPSPKAYEPPALETPAPPRQPKPGEHLWQKLDPDDGSHSLVECRPATPTSITITTLPKASRNTPKRSKNWVSNGNGSR